MRRGNGGRETPELLSAVAEHDPAAPAPPGAALSSETSSKPQPGPGWWTVSLVAALTAFLPFARGLFAGYTMYFRDLSGIFIPFRRFCVEGLLQGHLRYWNPYVHEGEPLPYPPVSYPFDLLQLLFRGEHGLSVLLALHVPLGALTFLALARGIGLSPVAGLGGALVYALAGFTLSCLNLYVYAQAAAWAPLLLLCLLHLVEADIVVSPPPSPAGRTPLVRGTHRWLVASSVVAGISLSSLGMEVVLEVFAMAAVLGFSRRRAGRLLRIAAAALLGYGLAGPALFVMAALVPGSERGHGFTPDVVLAQSVHPLTLVQILVANWHGDLSDVVNRWWGQNYFPRSFPYILSLYLGATALSLAWVGFRSGGPLRRRLGALVVLGLMLCLGRWMIGLPALVALSPLRPFRYPVKVFFTVHTAVALLAAGGLDAVWRQDRRAWRNLMVSASILGAVLLLGPRLLDSLAPRFVHWFVGGFFAPRLTWPSRYQRWGWIESDAALGGAVALTAAALGALGRARKLRASWVTGLLAALVAGDLLRTGAGLNPMVNPSFYRLSSEMQEALASLPDRERVFTCEVETSGPYWQARAARPSEHDLWTFATLMETLTPNFNMLYGVPTAYSEDLTSLTPASVVPAGEPSCASFGPLATRLRAAAVSHVISLGPLQSPELKLARTVTPARLAPLTLFVYELGSPQPLRSLEGGSQDGQVQVSRETADTIDLTVQANRPATLVMRETAERGWKAWIDGRPAPLLTVEGRYRAVRVPAGPSRVRLSYDPPGLRAGLAAALVSAAVLLAAWFRFGRRGSGLPRTRGPE